MGRDRRDLRAGLGDPPGCHADAVVRRDRVHLLIEVGNLEPKHEVGPRHVAAAQPVPTREIHALDERGVAHRRLQQFRELDHPQQALRRAGRAPGDDHRVVGGHEQLRQLVDSRGISRGRRSDGQPRHPQPMTVFLRNRLLLHRRIGHEDHRAMRRRHRNLVGAHSGFGEVDERGRRVVPFGAVADHRRAILHRVRPLRIGAPPLRVEDVAEHDVDGHTIGVGVVDGHRRVLQAHGAMGHHHHRLAFDLRVAVRHGHRRLFVKAGQQLRRAVAAVIDDRFVQCGERGPGIGGDVLEAERLDHVDHEVGARAIGGVDVGGGGRGFRRLRGLSLSRRGLSGQGSGHQGRGTGRGVLQESATPGSHLPLPFLSTGPAQILSQGRWRRLHGFDSATDDTDDTDGPLMRRESWPMPARPANDERQGRSTNEPSRTALAC